MPLNFSAALGIQVTTFSSQWAVGRSAMCHQRVFINWQRHSQDASSATATEEASFSGL